MSTTTTSAITNDGKYIKMKDLSAFKWLIINIFGHDYMHDYLINTKRTSKEKSIIDQINKMVTIIAAYKGKKKSLISLKGGGIKQNGGGLDISQNLLQDKNDHNNNINDLFTEASVKSWGEIDINDSPKYNLKIFEYLLENHIEKYQDLVTKTKGTSTSTSSSSSETKSSDIKISSAELLQEEKYIDELIVSSINQKFGEISEQLVSFFFQDIIDDIIKLTTDINENFSIDLSEDDDINDGIFTTDSDETTMDDQITGNFENFNIKSTETLPNLLEESIEKLSYVNVSTKVFNNLGVTHMWTKVQTRAQLAGTNALKTLKAQWKDKTLSLNDIEDVVQSSGETKSPSTTTSAIPLDRTLHEFTRNMILQEILLHPININSTQSMANPILFNSTKKPIDGVPPGGWFLHDIAEHCKNQLFGIFSSKYNRIFSSTSSPLKANYNFFDDDDETYIELIKRYFSLDLIKKSANWNKDNKDNEIIFNDLHNKAVVSLNGTNTENIKTAINQLFRFVVKFSHPDKFAKSSQVDQRIITANFSRILDTFQSIKKVHGFRGGGKKKTAAQIAQEQKNFIGLNTLLGKTIIENSLSLMKCITGNKNDGYFPLNGHLATSDHKLFFKSYPGRKPKFISIFNGQGMNTNFTAAGYIKPDGTVDWAKIYPTNYNTLPVDQNVLNGAPLELRKLLARRILLNIQVLILYLRCSPTEITVNKVLNGLYLSVDKTPRFLKHVKNTNYWSMGKTAKDSTSINQKCKIVGTSTNATGYPDEIINFINTNRTKWFGFMFDIYEDHSTAYPGFKPYVTSPEWLTTGTEDDALQYSFNLVLQKLLPEFILYMADNPIWNKTGFTNKKKMGEVASAGHTFPEPGTTTRNAYIINNAVGTLYPTEKKMTQSRFNFFNLTGSQVREAQYCPLMSIADNQSLCSVTQSKTAIKTNARSHNYDLEMGVEAEDAVGNTYSYIVNVVQKSTSIEEYFISAVLSIPGIPSIMIGDITKKNDLKGTSLGAVTTYFHLLKNMNKGISKFLQISRSTINISKGSNARTILNTFFEDNMISITNMCVKKSIGDYGQEHTACSKWGAGNATDVQSTGQNIVLPYTNEGDSLRAMFACDRPSAYRNIFMMLFAEEDTVNSRAIAGYWNESDESNKLSMKNTIIISPSSLLPGTHTLNSGGLNNLPESDSKLFTSTFHVNPQNQKYKQTALRHTLRYSKRITAINKFSIAENVKIRGGFAKWLMEYKGTSPLPAVSDDSYTKKNKLTSLKNEFLKSKNKIKGGRRKTKKRRSKKMRKITKRRSTKRKRKTIKKRKKKRRHRTRRK